MTDEGPTGRSVVELEFALGEELFFVRASETEECRIRLEEVLQRSDGSVLEFASLYDADPERFLELAEQEDDIRGVRLLRSDDEVALIELHTDSKVAMALADHDCTFTSITATAGRGRLVAEVPPHVESTTVVDAFIDQYPSAELVAKRQTERAAPTLTASQFRDSLVSGLTDRQFQALRTAHAAGYFDWPRETSTEAVAEELGVSRATLSEHLRVAEGKLFDALFDQPELGVEANESE